MFVINPILEIKENLEEDKLYDAIQIHASDRLVNIKDNAVKVSIEVLINKKSGFNNRTMEDVFVDNGLSLVDARELISTLFKENIIKKYETLSFIEREALSGCRDAKYHLSTIDYPFLNMRSDKGFTLDHERMDKYENEDGYPSPFYEHGNVESRKHLGFVKDAFSVEHLSQFHHEYSRDTKILAMIEFCSGMRRHEEPYESHEGYRQRELISKSVPSGGSRHPVETYLVTKKSHELNEGTYHYNVKRNSLDKLKNNFNLEKSNGLILLAPIYERAMWRYRESRSWRAIAAELGHYSEMYISVSQYFGLSLREAKVGYDKEITNCLGLDHDSQPVMISLEI
ncbi:hypothetical protein [Vibrio penaeicida]|uniref:hypothetical protein n=1 Tax=Vibrio penaeicida TaxID=104609 RepID=UPI000CE9AD92|nr:hypothetical protein [Vibrio penaeicida]